MSKTTKEVDRNEAAREQAKAQFASIWDMVDRLNHAQDCDGGEDCEASDEEIYGGLGLHWKEGDKATDEEREQYHDEDEARQAITEDALSVEVRSDWHEPGQEAAAQEFNILLCTGGPAVRIRGELNEHGEPDRAWMECQDWFTSWEQVTLGGGSQEILLTYARQFYFGE